MVQCGLDFSIIWIHESNFWFISPNVNVNSHPEDKKNSGNTSVVGNSVLQRVNVFLSVGREYRLQKGITLPSWLIWLLINIGVSTEVCTSRGFKEQLWKSIKACLKMNKKEIQQFCIWNRRWKCSPLRMYKNLHGEKTLVTEVPNWKSKVLKRLIGWQLKLTKKNQQKKSNINLSVMRQ